MRGKVYSCLKEITLVLEKHWLDFSLAVTYKSTASDTIMTVTQRSICIVCATATTAQNELLKEMMLMFYFRTNAEMLNGVISC